MIQNDITKVDFLTYQKKKKNKNDWSYIYYKKFNIYKFQKENRHYIDQKIKDK